MTGHDPQHRDDHSGDRPGEAALWRSVRRDLPGRCPDLQTLAALIDDRLPDDERDAVEGHLTVCGDCLDAVLETRLAIAERDERLPMVPRDVVPRARGLVGDAKTHRSVGARSWRWGRWGLAAAAAISVSIAGHAVGTSCGPERSIEAPVLAAGDAWSNGEILGIDPLDDPLLEASWILIGEVSP